MLIALSVTLIFAAAALAKSKPPTHSRGYMAALLLNKGLAGTPMAQTGFALVDAARPYGLNPALIAGIAGTESSYGAAACANDRYDGFGLASCGTGWSVPRFRSWRAAYTFMAGFITSHWPSARTPFDLHGYAACDACWGASTSRHMNELGFRATVRW